MGCNSTPLERFLNALDLLDLEAVTALMAPAARVLLADGRRAEGTKATPTLFAGLFAELRSTSHRVERLWHKHDTWVAEVDASYELRDWLQVNALPRVLIVRAGADGISELRAYGAHEHRLSDRPTGEEGMWVEGRWVPPL